MTRILFLTIVMVFIAGCSKSDVSGDVYIIKGDGSIAPSPGRDVFFIPIESENEFFSDLVAAGVNNAQKLVGATIVNQCEEIKNAAGKVIGERKLSLSSIEKKGNVPKEGCLGLTKLRDTQEIAANELLSEKNKKLESLNSQLEKLRSEKMTKIFNKADQLRDLELKKIITTNHNQTGSFSFTIKNNSEYCLSLPYSFKYSVHSNGLKVSENYLSTSQSLRDNLGFNIPNCSLLSNGILNASTYSWNVEVDVSKPSLYKAFSEGRLPTKDCGYRDVCAIIDRVDLDLSAVKFMKVTKVESKNSIEYITKPVNWNEKAKNELNLAETKEIKKIEDEISDLINSYENNPTFVNYQQAKLKADACLEDEPILLNMSADIKKAESIIPPTFDCNVSKSETIIPVISEANNYLELNFQVPTGYEEFVEGVGQKFDELLKHESTLKANTSIKGEFTLDDVPKGMYAVLGEYNDNFVNGFWLNTINIEDSEQTVDLNMKTFKNVSFTRFISAFDSLCAGSCLSSSIKMKSINYIAEAAETRFEELQKLEQEIKDLTRDLENYYNW